MTLLINTLGFPISILMNKMSLFSIFFLFIPHITQQIYPQDVIAIHDWILELLHLGRYTSIYILIQIVISRRTTELQLL